MAWHGHEPSWRNATCTQAPILAHLAATTALKRGRAQGRHQRHAAAHALHTEHRCARGASQPRRWQRRRDEARRRTSCTHRRARLAPPAAGTQRRNGRKPRHGRVGRRLVLLRVRRRHVRARRVLHQHGLQVLQRRSVVATRAPEQVHEAARRLTSAASCFRRPTRRGHNTAQRQQAQAARGAFTCAST